MTSARTLLVLAEDPADVAGVETLAAEARPLIPWNVLGFAGAPPPVALERADLVVALAGPAPEGVAAPYPDALYPDAGLAPPRLFRPLPEAPSRALNRILLAVEPEGPFAADGGVALAGQLRRRAEVTLATRCPATFLSWPALDAVAVRAVAGDDAWLDLLTQHDLVVTADAELALLALALLKPVVRLGGGGDPPFVFTADAATLEGVLDGLRPAELMPDLVNWKRAQRAGWLAALDGALKALGL